MSEIRPVDVNIAKQMARRTASKWRWLLDEAEFESVALMALVKADALFRRARGSGWVTFYRNHVGWDLYDTVRYELNRRRRETKYAEMLPRTFVPITPEPRLKQLLTRLSERERLLLFAVAMHKKLDHDERRFCYGGVARHQGWRRMRRVMTKVRKLLRVADA